MPSSSWGMPNAKRASPVSGSMPTRPSARPRKRLSSPRLSERAEQRRHGGERHDREREILGRPEPQRHRCEHRREERQRNRRERSRHERSHRRRRQRGGAAALARHHVSVDGGGNRSGFAGRVEQDAGGRAAVHRAVVDAAKHDEGADRIEAEGHREQHRNRERGADSGQHADSGAERHAGERPREVRQRDRVCETGGQRRQNFRHPA